MNGKLILLRRTELGLTQGDLTKKVGCCHRTVQRAEKGRQVFLRTAKEIAQALGVELRTIILLEPAAGDKRRRDGEDQSAVPGRTDDGTHEDRVVAAFKAADDAIQHTLGRAGEYDRGELTEVLSLLATRYGCASLRAVQVAFEQGLMAIPKMPVAEEGTALRGGAARS